MYGLKKRPKDESGLIQGAGTGTSDDVKKNVSAGSYIMPADSTQKIGTDNLKNMGNPTPVNLSNGEFQLSPEQVHSVGVQTLDAMKNQTHTPVDQPQLGFKPGQNKPELFFANGGEVEWSATDKAKAAVLGGSGALYGATKLANTVPSITGAGGQVTMGQTAKGLASGAWDGVKNIKGKNIPGMPNSGAGRLGALGALATTAVDTATTSTEQYRERFGLGDYNPEDSNGMRFAKDLGVRALGSASDLGNNLTLGLAGKYYQDKQNATQEQISQPTPPATKPDPTKTANAATTPDPTSQAAEKAKANAAAKVAASTTPPTTDMSQQNTKQPISMFTDTSIQNTAQATDNPYAIQQKGNSFSYANPSAAAEARSAGVPELQRTGIQTGRGIRGVNEFMANTRKMGPSEQQIQNAIAQREMNIGIQGRAGIPRQPQVQERTPEQEAQLQAEIKRVSAPIAGARGLTASQRNQINDLQQGYSNRANDMYKTDANNAAALQREAMGQAGQNYRTELGEQGTNNRYNSGLNLEAQKFNATNDLANRQFSADQFDKMPARMKQQAEVNLLQAYDKAQTDEERKPILEKLGMLRGQAQQQSGKDRYMTVGGGQQWDDKAGATLTQPQRLFDTQTQQFVNTPQGSTQQPLQNHIDALKKNPSQAAQFDEIYGQGASAKYLS